MIETEPGADWRDLQTRVAAILTECGIPSEVGKTIETARGNVAIDVHGIDPTTTPPAVYLCECKRWNAPVPQGEVQIFRTVVADSGAHYGLVISARGFQAGARDVVQHTNIHLLNWLEFQDMFEERWCRNYWIPTFRAGADRLASYAEPVNSDAARRHSSGEPLEPEEAIGLMALDMWSAPFLDAFMEAFMPAPRQGTRPLGPAIWQMRDSYKQYLPAPVQQSTCLRSLLTSLLEFAAEWMSRTGNS